MPESSIIIATYNAGEYLLEAVRSVLSQSRGDLELIVVDDGSDDGSTDCLGDFDDTRLQLIRQQNAGQTSAKNRGIEASSGAYVGFCDADDYWYPDKLERQIPVLEKNTRAGVVYTRADTVDAGGNPVQIDSEEQHSGDIFEPLFLKNFIPFGTALVRKQCLDELGTFDPNLRMGIDWELWLRIAAHYEFEALPEATYAYRLWEGQMSHNWRGRYSSAFRIMEKTAAAYPERVSQSLYQKARANTFANKSRARRFDEPFGAMLDAIFGVMLDPLSSFSWKTVGRNVLDFAKKKKSSESPVFPRERYVRTKTALAPIVRRLTRSAPRIFIYHRFGPTTSLRRYGRNAFREQMKYLRRHCHILTFSDLLDEHFAGYHGRQPLAAVTVDDGYADFHEYCLPVLNDLKIPATVFITTDFVDGKCALWPDVIRKLVDAAASGEYRLDEPWDDLYLDLRDASSRDEAWHRLADRLVYVDDTLRLAALAQLEKTFDTALDSLSMEDCASLSWKDVNDAIATGCEIGGHSIRHSFLPSLERDALLADLGETKSRIESMTGTRVRALAYPNGTFKDFDDNVVQAARETGYEYAALSVPFNSLKPCRYAVGRFSGNCSQLRFRQVIAGFGILRSTIVTQNGQPARLAGGS